MDKLKLKPCPFCGHADHLMVMHVKGTDIHPAYRVYCDWCGIYGPTSDHGDHGHLWNTRAAQAETEI